MKLKALTIGLALSFPMLASAQSTTSVTLYGTIDTAIEYVNKIPQYNANGQQVAKHSSGHFTDLTSSWPSHWGLRGEEKINENLSAVFALESGFAPGNGNSGQGARLFGRQAWVGLKGDWGQVAFGRQYNMLFWGLLGADIMGPNAYGLGALDSYIPNARMDNSITYRGTFSGIKVGAAYARGRDNAGVSGTNGPGSNGPANTNCRTDYNSQSACGAWSAMLGYDAANWGVAAAYDVINGSDNFLDPAATFGGLNETSKKDKRMMLNGYVKFDALKVSLIYINRKNDGAQGDNFRLGNRAVPNANNPNTVARGDLSRSDLWSLAAAYNISPAVTIDGSINYLRFKNANDGDKAMYYVARAKYALSKRTSVYVSGSYIKNSGQSNISAAGGTAGLTGPAGSEIGGSQMAVMTGLRHNF